MGATHGETLGTQRASFPNGFRGDHCYRRTLTGSAQALSTWGGATWDAHPDAAQVTTAQGTDFFEASIPRAALGATTRLGMVSLVLDTVTPERAFAGLYPGTFTDGNFAPGSVPLAYFFASDLTSKSTGNILNVDAGNAAGFTR